MRDTAIRNTHPNVASINAGINATDAKGNVVVLDEALITAEVIRLQAEYDSLAYARLRQAEYPPIDEVVVALAEKAEGNDAMWLDVAAKRTAVKLKYPKN